MLALAQLANQLQLLVVGTDDHRRSLRVGGFFSWNARTNKKRAVFTARPGE
jgi:hypothetical protein